MTEEVTGLDIVVAQLQLAGGMTLADIGLRQADVPAPRGYAIQARVNAETMAPDGSPRPSGGTLTTFEVPSGPRVRTDTCGYAGYTPAIRFDSLLAKVIAWSPSNDFAAAANHAYRALCEMRIDGVQTNLPLLQALLAHPDVTVGRLYTTLRRRSPGRTGREHSRRPILAASSKLPVPAPRETRGARGRAWMRSIRWRCWTSGSRPPGRCQRPRARPKWPTGGFTPSPRPSRGRSSAWPSTAGDEVRKGQALLVMEAMKMEHVIRASCSGVLRELNVVPGEAIYEGHPLAYIEEQAVETARAKKRPQSTRPTSGPTSRRYSNARP